MPATLKAPKAQGRPSLGLAPKEAVALDKFPRALADAARQELVEGSYPVEFKVRVTGTLIVPGDYHQLFVTSGDLQRLLALAVAKLHARTGETLADLVGEAFPDPESFVLESVQAQAQQQAKEIRALLEVGKPKTLCKGQVRAALEFRRLK